MTTEQQQLILNGEQFATIDRSYIELNRLSSPREFPNMVALARNTRNMELSLKLANIEAHEKMNELRLEFNSLITGAAQMYHSAAVYANMVHSELSLGAKKNLQGREAESILNHIIYQTDLLIKDHTSFIKLYTDFKTSIANIQRCLRTSRNEFDKDLMTIEDGDNKLTRILKEIASSLMIVILSGGASVVLSKRSPLTTGISIAVGVVTAVAKLSISDSENDKKIKHLKDYIALIDQYNANLDEIKTPTAENLAIFIEYRTRLTFIKRNMDYNLGKPFVELSEVSLGYTLEKWEELAEEFSATNSSIKCKIIDFEDI